MYIRTNFDSTASAVCYPQSMLCLPSLSVMLTVACGRVIVTIPDGVADINLAMNISTPSERSSSIVDILTNLSTSPGAKVSVVVSPV